MRKKILAAAAVPALALAACGDGGPTDIDPGTPYTFQASGRVHTIGGSVPAGLRAHVAGVDGATSVAIGADGRFSIQARVATDSVDVVIDTQAGAARTTLPALVRVAGRRSGQNITVALVPTQWTIPTGAYAGTTSQISVDAAFRPPCTTPNDLNCDGFYPIEWVRGVKLWPANAFPVRVAFDHQRTHQPITAADSIAFWNIVATMNADMGRTLFQPARAADLAINSEGRPTNGVTIRVDTTLAGFGAWTNWWWSQATGDLNAGAVRARTVSHVRTAGLMTHELLHTQGFKHSCSWPTVMGGYGCSSMSRLSVADVAHAQVAFEIRALQLATGAAHGILAALQGERAVMLAQPALTAAAIRRLELPVSSALVQGDSIMHRDHAH